MPVFDRVQKALLILFCVGLVTSMSAMELFAALLILVLIARLVLDPDYRRTLRVPPLTYPIVAFSLVVATGVLLGDASSADKWRDIARLRFFFMYCVLYWELTRQRRVESKPWKWISVVCGACLIVSLYGFVQHFIPIDLIRPLGKKVILYAIPEKELGPLVVGFFNHHLTFANIFLMYAALFLALGLSKVPRRFLYSTVGIFLCVCTVWTNSRSAWLALPFVLLFLGLQKSRQLAAVFLASALILLVSSYVFDAGFRERMDRTVFQRDTLYNGDERYRLWHANWEMFKEHPIVGIGWNNNERQAPIFVDRLYPHIRPNFYGHAHSMPIQILSTTGGLGLLSFLWIWGALFALVWRTRAALSKGSRDYWILAGCSAAFLGFWIQGMTQWNFGDAEVQYNLLFLWAVATSLATRRTLLEYAA